MVTHHLNRVYELFDGDLEVTSGDIGLLGGYLPVAELEECRSPGREMLAPIGHGTDGL